MKKLPLSKQIRLILGIAAVLLAVALAWALQSVLGDLSALLLIPGGGVFMWLNPELMSGD